MSELPSHGTGWAESEVLLDLMTLYNTFDASDESVPDFTTVQRRLRESFNLTELRSFELITRVMTGLIDLELSLRNGDPDN